MKLFRTTLAQADLGLFILRLAAGGTFAAHGGQKLFGFGIAGVTGAFTQMGAPMPGVTAPIIAVLEFAGGLALVAGLLTRLAALGLIIDMAGAIAIVHYKNGYFLPTGVEFVLLLLSCALTLLVAGPGAYSLDALLGRRARR
ncbi:DoxX family protein [Gemmatirosa kalamazoonensis]|uniref:DoxX family protein n=1 Tax=Gemmatirosa kalamazoonensis TaxID=861299 RepID=W0RB97_9BACT|nr:DoxX family protein [Gemmatirosa kalamazoonensis]AHG88369.1 DoxX family protein [Gemmatirosa kalamazoonensis]